ncbi:MAG: hypothetical protein AAB527_03570 [Patescibacteria group bacterium]
MDIITALVLVALITLAIKAANKFLPFSVCAFCAGVSGAWVFLSFAVLTGIAPAASYLPVITLLMGGTVVGIAYQAEKKFGWQGEKSFWLKFAIIVGGFYAGHIAAGGLNWITFTLELVALTTLVYLFFIRRSSGANSQIHSAKVAELEEQMKNCC